MQIGALNLSKLQRAGSVATVVRIPVRNTLHIISEAEGEGLAKFSVHLPAEDSTLLEQYAAVENALESHRRVVEKEEGRPPTEPKVKWSRKELAVHVPARSVQRSPSSACRSRSRKCGPAPRREDSARPSPRTLRRLHDWQNKKLNRG
jgi:hypothetical protein